MTTHGFASDQGTLPSRTVLFGPDMRHVTQAAEEFSRRFPHPGGANAVRQSRGP